MNYRSLKVLFCLFIILHSTITNKFMVRLSMNCKNIYKEIGKRFKENREIQNLTQADLAEKVGTSVTYISSVERGLSFPRGDKLVAILNALNSSADSVFCDVVQASAKQRASILYDMLLDLPSKEQNRILETVEFLIRQSKNGK